MFKITKFNLCVIGILVGIGFIFPSSMITGSITRDVSALRKDDTCKGECVFEEGSTIVAGPSHDPDATSRDIEAKQDSGVYSGSKADSRDKCNDECVMDPPEVIVAPKCASGTTPEGICLDNQPLLQFDQNHKCAISVIRNALKAASNSQVGIEPMDAPTVHPSCFEDEKQK